MRTYGWKCSKKAYASIGIGFNLTIYKYRGSLLPYHRAAYADASGGWKSEPEKPSIIPKDLTLNSPKSIGRIPIALSTSLTIPWPVATLVLQTFLFMKASFYLLFDCFS